MRYGARTAKGRVDVDGTDGVDPSFPRIGANRIVEIRRHPWTTRRRGGGSPTGAKGQSGQGDPDRSAGSGGSPVLWQLRLQQTRRARTRRRTPGARRGSAPSAALRSPLFPSFLAATWSAGSTKCAAASPTAASAGSTWRSTATSTTAGWCSRVWCTPATPTRWPPPPPKPSPSPRWNTPTSSGSTTSSSTRIRKARRSATSSWSTSAAHRSSRSARRTTGLCRRDQAVAYIVEIAPALGYLHEEGLAYCDFKPDNVMQSDEQLKLIDLGATVAMDDDDAVIYGTRGYQAPEIAWTGPTVASDVYTVGRTLAVLVMDFPQRTAASPSSCPAPRTVPVFAQHESLYRAILRATDSDPERRFPSMDELADQLTGVLHEIAAADSDHPQPRISSHFSPQRAIYAAGWDVALSTESVIAALGVPRVDANDPGAALLATTSGTPPAQLEQTLEHAVGGENHRSNSIEVPLRLVRASLEVGAAKDARRRLAELESVIPRRLAADVVQRAVRPPGGRFRRGRSRFRCGTDDVARRARSQARACGDRRTARCVRRSRPLLRDGVADEPQLLQRGVRPGAAASPGGRPCRRHRHTRPDHHRISAFHRGRHRRRSRSSSTAEPPTISTNRRCSMRASAPRR